MPRTVEEYVQATREMLEHGTWETRLEPTSAVLHYTANSSMIGSGFTFGPDFGYVVAFCRCQLLSSDFDPDHLPLWKYSREELARRERLAGEALDDLLGRYIAQGYTPELGERLLQIGDDYFHEYSLNEVYVLPQDLERLFTEGGNPWQDDEGATDEELVQHALAKYDPSNPGHREQLAEHLSTGG